MIDIECPEPIDSECECCGGITTRLTRFVTREGNAYAIYHAMYGEQHRDRGVIGIVGLGDWFEGSNPESRVAFAVRLWFDGTQFQVTIIDALESPWKDVNIISRKLSRDEGLRHPWIQDVFHITDHITLEDPAIREFFAEETLH